MNPAQPAWRQEVSAGVAPAALPRDETAAGLAPHLVASGHPEWAYWRTVCVRSAGFDARLVDELAVPSCAAAADELLDREHAVADARRAAIAALTEQLDAAADEEARRGAARALKQVRRRKIPDGVPDAVRAGLASACAAVEEGRARYARAFERAVAHVAERVKRIASDSRFREAVVLQNARGLRRVDGVLERAGSRRGGKERQAHELIASYLQRYCVKNDTIGFFGPAGWASLEPERRGIDVRPGPGLVRRSGVYFENWVIETLADEMSGDPAYKPWLRPRLLPLFHLDAGRLLTPAGTHVDLAPLDAAILSRCDGARTAREIAAEILAGRAAGAATPQDVYAALDRLVAKRAIVWRLEVPVGLHPERTLRRAIEPIDDEPVRRRALARLEALEARGDEVRRALGDGDRLSHALDALDQTFETLTGRSATRAAGQMYAARTLVFADCERDVDIEIGGDVLDALSGPLSLLFTSARWLTWRTAVRCRSAFDEIYRRLAPSDGAPVDLVRFWMHAQPLVLGPGARLVDPVVAEFRRRWRAILPVTPGERQACFTTCGLRDAVEAHFAAPRAGWEGARYHSPDVMIAARDAGAVARGDYLAVMGELHLTKHTFSGASTLAQHPRPEELFAGIDADSSRPGVTLIPPRSWPRLTSRTAPALVPSHNCFLEPAGDAVADVPWPRRIPIGAMVVERTPAGLRVRTRDRRRSFDVVELFGDLIALTTVDAMKDLHDAPHVPRIVVDKLVLGRESWTFDASALEFVDTADEGQRYLHARAWQRANGLPRRAFGTVAVETKPFYVDFDSPIYVEIFVKMVRRLRADGGAAVVKLSEMLPTPDLLWLRDAEGRHYTSELRIVARDLVS